MTLHVHTARVSSGDPDRLDITRKSGDELGKTFAPSWRLLRPFLTKREIANQEKATFEEQQRAQLARIEMRAGFGVARRAGKLKITRNLG